MKWSVGNDAHNFFRRFKIKNDDKIVTVYLNSTPAAKKIIKKKINQRVNGNFFEDIFLCVIF